MKVHGRKAKDSGGVASSWSRNRPAEILSCVRHAVVVRDDSGEVGTELLRRREMNSVERPQVNGQHFAGSVQNPRLIVGSSSRTLMGAPPCSEEIAVKWSP